MGLSSAVLWWEDWQLRILVLGSLFVQYLLFFSAPFRKSAIPSWYRFIIWLSYLGSDALAIYALATLFSRQSKQDYNSMQDNGILEVVWAPVLLMHLGGQDGITAYNMEDNELWARHVITAVSQITVAIYVFCKSWPGGNQRLLQASILFFIPGILKCIEKPWALKSASFNSLVSLSGPNLYPEMTTNRVTWFLNLCVPGHRRQRRASEADLSLRMVSKIPMPLEEYVEKARALVLAKRHPRTREAATVDLELNHIPPAQGEDLAVNFKANYHHRSHEEPDADNIKPNGSPDSGWLWILRLTPPCFISQRDGTLLSKEIERRRLEREAHNLLMNLEARKLFVDLASSYPARLSILEVFLVHGVDKTAYASLQEGLWEIFNLLYTRIKMQAALKPTFKEEENTATLISYFSAAVRGAAMILPFAAIGLFHKSHRDAYDVYDVKITYALFCCTAVLQFLSMTEMVTSPRLPGKIAQYSLVGFFVRNERHNKKMFFLSFLNCKDFLDQRWCMKSCSSSSRITDLVLRHVRVWWEEQIVDVASYRRFSDHRGQWTIKHTRCNHLEWSLNRPFDESVLLWHIATDLCIYKNGGPSLTLANATECREISNYLIYLLFVNPEMLLSGTRRNLFMTANAELEEILKNDKPLIKKILKGDKPSLMETLKGNNPFLEFLKRKGPSPEEIERGFMQRIIAKLSPTQHREDTGYTEQPTEAEQYPSVQEGFIQDAWKISEALLALGDKKMWEVIEGMWVEMLCFSASRCRGYVHAKSLGTGGQLLTYIWLLLARMGMETLPERMQRTDI